MTFQEFLEKNEVTDIPPELSEAMDEVGENIVKLAYVLVPPSIPGAAAPPVPIPPQGLAAPVAAAVVAKTGGTPADAAGLTVGPPPPGLLAKLELDINALIISLLTAGATSLNLKPAPGPPSPVAPIVPAALAVVPVPDPNALKFAKAALEWAASFCEGDARLAGPITVLAP
jgi:hypothetical protein